MRGHDLRPSSLLLVFLGGAAGTAVRAGLLLALPASGDLPVTTVGVNTAGSYLLGLLVGVLARVPHRGHHRRLRLLLGTGFLGGFTTYSTLATDGAVLIGAGLPGTAALYALGTLVLGVAAAWAGIATAARSSARRTR